jgi:two-component system sensor histidine kinase MtrB
MPHADRNERAAGRRRTLTRASALLGCALLLAGCATMPDNGQVSKVAEEPRTESDPQVRVFGVQPQKDEQPIGIVRGFLEATTSDDVHYQTALKYLTTAAAAKWNPSVRITVVSGTPQFDTVHNGADRLDNGVTIAMSVGQVATVDGDSSYTPSDGTYHSSFHLSQVNGQWRIDGLPNGLMFDESDFERLYHSVNKYYFAQLGPDADDTPAARDILVADPVYVRRRIDPITSSVRALLAGPSSWVKPVVTSAFPAHTQLKTTKVALDESDRLRVPLGNLPRHLGHTQCDQMAAQLLNTVQEQSSTPISSVEVARADGGTLCTLSRQQAGAYSPKGVDGNGSQQYFVDSDHRMESMPSDGGSPQRVPGPFGGSQPQLRWVAVSRDQQTAAAVKTDGRTLEVAPLSGSGGITHVLTSKTGLSAPSWDGLGDLWVADRTTGAPPLKMWRDGHTTAVSVPDLGSGRIQGVRVAADGVRIALLVKRDGRTELQLGRVERLRTSDGMSITVDGLRPIAPGFEDVQAVAWAGASRLVVLGKQWRGVQQLRYVDTDGSAAFNPTLPGISTVTAVAAFEDQSRPLLVASQEAMFRLPTDADWEQVSTKGTFPVYPG